MLEELHAVVKSAAIAITTIPNRATGLDLDTAIGITSHSATWARKPAEEGDTVAVSITHCFIIVSVPLLELAVSH